MGGLVVLLGLLDAWAFSGFKSILVAHYTALVM
jgi:hypothetical protein